MRINSYILTGLLMCSIYGAYTQHADGIDPILLDVVREAAKDRGRDGGRKELFEFEEGGQAVMGNWRATPTTETKKAPYQPYGGIVHNGTIANDQELGAKKGEVDSMVLDRVLKRGSIHELVESLEVVKGSYALGVIGKDRVYLATNYKPVYILKKGAALYFSSMERHLLSLCETGTRPQRLLPYTGIDLKSGLSVEIPRENNSKVLVICSGGLDSTTVAYQLVADGYSVTLLHFSYGCHAEERELNRIEKISKHLSCPLVVLPLDYQHYQGSSLLSDKEIAGGIEGAEFAHEWVPARNLLMISNAVAYAESSNITTIALGNNLEEAGAYPDNEEEFTNLLDQVLDYAVHDGGNVRLLSPVGKLMKHEIVSTGINLGVPFDLTWSCYKAGEHHCGDCGPCFMRKTAFERNGNIDPVIYENDQ